MKVLYKCLLLSAAVAYIAGQADKDAEHRRPKAFLDGTSDGYPCSQTRGSCWFTTDIKNGKSFFNISCDCSGSWVAEKDVSKDLKKIMNLACQGKPTEDEMILNYTSISIKACKTNEAFPDEMVAMVRRSEHLDIKIQDSPRFRMKAHKKSSHIVPKISVTITNSKIGGLVSGWFTGTRKLELKIEGSTVDVVDSKALMGFPSEAVTNIQITNSTLKTIKMSAMELPAESNFIMDNCKVNAWNNSAYVGGRSLVLSNLVVGRMLQSAINIRGLESFKLFDSTFAELTAEAIVDRETSHMRNERNSDRVALANVTGNTFAGANGEAFVHLCDVEKLIFKNNQFLKIEQPPLRICRNTQDETSNRHRDWTQVFRNNGLPCNDCSDFSVNNNNQVCNMYTSSHCTCGNSNSTITPACKDRASLTKTVYDACNFKPECPETADVAAAAVPAAAAHSNDALPLPIPSSFILRILVLVQIGYLFYY